MSSAIQLPVLITGLSTKVDGSIKIVLETRELRPSTAAEVFALRGMEAWALLAPSVIKDAVLPDEKPDPAIGAKTPSRRVRAVLYRIWEQKRTSVDFESYYRTQMEAILDQLKERLE